MEITKRILIVEDQATECIALREILGVEPSWSITVAQDGQEALDLLCDGYRPDVCLLDLRIPKIDGLQMLQRMRRDPVLKHIKVIVTSSTRDKDTILALAKLHISGYLLKPCDAEKAMAVLRPLLNTPGTNPSLAPKVPVLHSALVIDDTPAECNVLKDIFRSEPTWDCIIANDGQDALNRLQSGLRPELILIDLRLPNLEGLSVIKQIRQNDDLNQIRIVVISTGTDRELINALAQLNISGYLLKPFTEAKVKAFLQKAPGTDTKKKVEAATA